MIDCDVGPESSCTSHSGFLDCPVRRGIWFTTLIVIQLASYGLLTMISSRFLYGSVDALRPLVSFYAIMAGAFAAYLCSIPLALRTKESAGAIALFIGVAIASRAIVLVSEPIQEVDIYRYIWDGAVSGQGISPYRYPPLEIQQPSDENADGDIDRLAQLVTQQPGLGEVLRRVHYSELPTVYPPVSQVVFRLSDTLTPADASVTTRVRIMKGWIVLFDVGVMLLLIGLLRRQGLHVGWSIAYGWCPLVIKEFANSGHLDSIAVFFVIAALLLLAVASRGRSPWRYVVGSAILLGLGVGAKLYPLVLLPLLACFLWKDRGAKGSMAWLAIAALTIALSLMPMLVSRTDAKPQLGVDQSVTQLEGLTAFLSRWEINDLLFMVVEENLRPEGSMEGQPPLWFAITPDRWRTGVVANASRWLGSDSESTPFLVARILTTLLWGVIALALCRQVWRAPGRIHESAFLTLAWFWLLSPTQNPWYWIWALPLVPWTRNRVWLLMSGITLIYYGRFWLEYNAVATADWGLSYQGVQIFDFVVVWIEFAPFLMLLWWTGRVGE